MTGGLQTTGQRVSTDRAAVAAAARTDTHNTYSQQEYAMPESKSMTAVQRPQWATSTRICDELVATIYHSNTTNVREFPGDRADHIKVELYVADHLKVTDDGIDYQRDEPMIQLDGGIVDLAAACEIAAALVKFVTDATATSPQDSAFTRSLLTHLDRLTDGARLLRLPSCAATVEALAGKADA